MGKKDKRVDKAKLDAKKERKASKQEKLAHKRVKKEVNGSKSAGKDGKESKEQDIEAILAEFAAKEKTRTAVTVTLCPGPPSPRAQFSLTSASSSASDMLMFGGEFFDGEETTVYNELYRWNVEKNEWRIIESLNTPPPRCSHQAVYYKDRIYVFGGEYATLDQFYHYRDMWCLDIKTNVWKEVKPQGDVPTARSGHRMVVWRNYIVLFGGFYEAMRDVKWYNDLYLFSFQDERWIQIPYKSHALIPKPRSGHQMVLHAAEDCIYVYGGYSKEKNPGKKAEGKIHEDLWLLNLKPLIASGSSLGKGMLDLSKASWQKISKKGAFPSPRSGTSMIVYKNKAVLFGGVFDIEGPRHSLISTFYNDMYAFDMERRRWYQLGLKQASAAKIKDATKKSKSDTTGKGDNDDDEDSASDDEEEDPSPDTVKEDQGPNYDDGDYFGFIDESGNVVYVDLDPDESSDQAALAAAYLTTENDADNVGSKMTEKSLNIEEILVTDKSVETASSTKESSVDSDVLSETSKVVEQVPAKEMAGLAIADSPSKALKSPSSKVGKVSKVMPIAAAVTISTAFVNRKDPYPRINPCLILKGNSLMVYGGLTEIGDVEVTLDDCWSLDLNKRDHWRQLLRGTMETMTWKGEDDETEGTRSETADSDGESDDGSESDKDSSDSNDSSSDEDDLSDDENVTDEPVAKATPKKQAAKASGSSNSKTMGVKQEMEKLRDELNITDNSVTPESGESLRDFYSRTTEYWTQRVIEAWRERESSGNGLDSYQAEILTEKAIKREGFKMAENRFNELLPILARLDELQAQQQELEESNSSSKNKSKQRR